MKNKLAILLLLIGCAAIPAGAQLANPYTNASGGTTLNSLATVNTSNQAVLATTSNTNVPTYIVVGGAGTSGVAQLAVVGQAPCTMDTTIASAAGHFYVIASTTTGGDCHPQSAAPAVGTWVDGYLAVSATTSGSTALVDVTSAGFYFGTGTAGTGSCTNQVVTAVNTGSPTCTTATSAYVDSSVMADTTHTTTAQGEVPSSTTTAGQYAVGDLWLGEYVPSANCVKGTAGSGWSIGSSGTVTCRAGTNNLGGFVAITDTSSSFAQFQIRIPEDWDTASDPQIRFYFGYPGTDGASAHTIIPEFQTSCAKGDGSTSDDVTFNALHSSSTITLSSATANLFFSGSHVQMNSTDVTGCVAGSMMIIQVGRATDTATSAANFYGVTVTWPHLNPGTAQAN